MKTQRAPVVFSPEIARGIIGNIFEAANGDAIYRHATFFEGMLGERVAGENITVIDDGTMVFDTTAYALAASAPRRSMAKACPRGGRCLSNAAS